jgi:hypothetical protein
MDHVILILGVLDSDAAAVLDTLLQIVYLVDTRLITLTTRIVPAGQIRLSWFPAASDVEAHAAKMAVDLETVNVVHRMQTC